MGITEVEKIKKDILDQRCYLKRVIKSVKTTEHLEAAQRLADNWKSLTFKRIDSFKPFFFRSSSGWRSSLELYYRVEKDIDSLLASKKAILRFHKKDEIYDYA